MALTFLKALLAVSFLEQSYLVLQGCDFREMRLYEVFHLRFARGFEVIKLSLK
jgi:hypothetical protein